MVVAPCLTVKPHLTGLRWLSHQCIHYDVLRFAVFLKEKLDLWLCFAYSSFSTVLFHGFWQECLVETLESVWVLFSLLGLLELCQLAYLQYWVLCLTHPRLAPSQSASWSGLWGFSTALKYALTYPTFCLVCIGGRSSMNLMFSLACCAESAYSCLCPASSDP